ncbi:MAG: glycoside hydrolase family 3 C-terminal domain-containing protein [Chloroflexi bacterium]|nr:glycoside hydrolase family 3 C-terminal domain-containing protein [Chloroflexota bacterium]
MSKVNNLLAQMTLEEKISLLAGADLWHSVPVPRLGIPQFKVTDGPNGARGAWGSMAPPSVATPVGIALGATWNPALVEKIGNVLADELEAKGAHILLAPTVNIHRTPIAGRNFECYSEDPFLSGMIASAYIKGIQDQGKGACIKHFVANDQEHERTSISSEVDERALREIYLEPFRLAIRTSKPWAVMSAYNRVNGTYACQNDHTLKDILKGEWGFEGIVMSDWFGTYDAGVTAGGLDLEMPGPARWMSAEAVKKALDNGSLTEDSLNDKVRRLLEVIEKAGLFDKPELQKERGDDKPQHRRIMREAAREAIVLLKNEKRLLPLRKVRSIAVIGPYAATAQILGGGSSSVTPHYAVSPFEGIKARAGNKVKVETAPGCHIYKTLPAPAPETLSTADGRIGLSLSLFNGTECSGAPAYTEVTTRLQHGWFDKSVPNVNQESFSMRMEGFFTPKESGVHTLALGGVGWCKLYLDEKLVVDHSHDLDMGKQVFAEVELEGGNAYALKLEYYWKGDPRWRSVSLGHQPPQPLDLIGEAVKLAQKADVVVVVAGLNGEWESEGFDRVDMKLPGEQDKLIRKIARANKNTVVVLNTGSPVEMPWIEKVPAVLQLWYDGQEQGNALADVLFGDVSPSGKLPTTFPVRLEDNPAYINYPGENGRVRYGEGIFVGYRYYDKKKLDPLFPFGHGLSYTTFQYSNLRLSATSITPNDTLKVKVDVTNTGRVAGSEIVQLYVRDIESSFARPEKELKGFAKIELKPKQKKTVTFTLDREAFWYFDTAKNDWNTEAGEFEILVGASSRDIRLRQQVNLLAPKTSRLHTGMSLRALLADETGKAVLARYFGEWLENPLLEQGMEMTLDQLSNIVPDLLTPALLETINRELAQN